MKIIEKFIIISLFFTLLTSCQKADTYSYYLPASSLSITSLPKSYYDKIYSFYQDTTTSWSYSGGYLGFVQADLQEGSYTGNVKIDSLDSDLELYFTKKPTNGKYRIISRKAYNLPVDDSSVSFEIKVGKCLFCGVNSTYNASVSVVTNGGGYLTIEQTNLNNIQKVSFNNISATMNYYSNYNNIISGIIDSSRLSKISGTAYLPK